jgi:hypothetical protein
MHVLFLAPESQIYYREFVRGLKEIGARVTGLGHLPRERLPSPLRAYLDDYVAVKISSTRTRPWPPRAPLRPSRRSTGSR